MPSSSVNHVACELVVEGWWVGKTQRERERERERGGGGGGGERERERERDRERERERRRRRRLPVLGASYDDLRGSY
jgi:hypothetical protein